MIGNYNDHKRFFIMNIINHLGAISRTELAEVSGYQPATISTITKQLIDEHILTETGSYSVGPGRKRTLLELNKAHLCAISIAFSSNEITFFVTQFDGTILREIHIDFPKNLSEKDFLSLIVMHVKQLLDSYQERNIIGLGICTPANDPSSYPIASFLSTYPRLSHWIDAVLVPALENAVSIPVSVFYGTALGVIAEQNFGVAKGVNDFICVELSNGIGCSICCNGKAVIGSEGRVGELGHTVISSNTFPLQLCYCGKPNCVEATNSFPELVKIIQKSLENNTASILKYDPEVGITASDIRIALENGDLMCRHHVKHVATSIGLAIANAAMLLNPKLIVLSGHMLELGDYFLDTLETTVRENVCCIHFDFAISPHAEKLWPLGAIAEIFSRYLKRDVYDWIYQMPTE